MLGHQMAYRLCSYELSSGVVPDVGRSKFFLTSHRCNQWLFLYRCDIAIPLAADQRARGDICREPKS
jgi:hypothetical protein